VTQSEARIVAWQFPLQDISGFFGREINHGTFSFSEIVTLNQTGTLEVACYNFISGSFEIFNGRLTALPLGSVTVQ
jgi:hypothetical protein